MNQPIACSLSPSQAAGRAEQTAAIAARALLARHTLSDGDRLRFGGDTETEAALREVIAAEAECCSFLRLELRWIDNELELDITGPDDARPIIEALFA